MIFDQGAGIPETLKRNHSEHIRRYFSAIGPDSVIKDKRGLGLRDVARFIEEAPHIGQLKVKSNRGIYELKKLLMRI